MKTWLGDGKFEMGKDRDRYRKRQAYTNRIREIGGKWKAVICLVVKYVHFIRT